MERLSPENSLVLPDTIHHIIDTDLMLVSEGRPSQTQRYITPSYPDLLIRHNDRSVDYATISKTAKVFNELPSFGINSLPYVPLEHNGEPYVVTLKVEGENLVDIIVRGDFPPDLIREIDALWASLSGYLVYGKESLAPIAADIYTPNQYMYGTVAGSTTPRLWLVDLGEHTNTFKSESEKRTLSRSLLYDEYEGELLDLINAVLSIEKLIGVPLVSSRHALVCAVEEMTDRLLVESFSEAIENNRRLRPEFFFPEGSGNWITFFLGTTE